MISTIQIKSNYSGSEINKFSLHFKTHIELNWLSVNVYLQMSLYRLRCSLVYDEIKEFGISTKKNR